MECPFCGFAKTNVTDTRHCDGDTVRKRVCPECGKRFTTAERINAEWMQVRKRDGSVEPFSKAKLAKGIEKAASVHQLSPGDVNTFVDRVIQVLHPDSPSVPIPSSEIGRLVLQQLHGDTQTDVVRVRYAMVQLGRTTRVGGFNRLGDFLEWLEGEYGPAHRAKPAATPSVVIKRDGRREPFEVEKLARSIGIAAKGRGKDTEVRSLALHVATQAQQALTGQVLVTSQQVAAEALAVLRERDLLAYLRYASAVKRYQSVDDFWAEALGLQTD